MKLKKFLPMIRWFSKYTPKLCGESLLLLILLFSITFAPSISIFLVTTQIVYADFNQQINYQAKLTDSSNVAVSDGLYNVEFNLYTVASGGSPIWTETLCKGSGCDGGAGTDARVTLANGLFSTMLGSTTPFTGVDFNQTLYLGVNIGGSAGTPTWDGEMTPRKILGAVPAAFQAQQLGGLNSSQFLRSDAVNSTSTASSFITITQSGGGNALLVTDGLTSLASLLTVGSTTLQNFTFLTATGTSATTTNFFSDTLTATDFYTTSFTGGSGTTTNFAVLNSFSVTGSATSTFGNGLDLTDGCFSIAGVCVGGATGGLTSLNGLTDSTQTFAVGTSGSDFNISSAGGVHTFNLPDASDTVRGLVTTGNQTFAGVKTFANLMSLGSTTLQDFTGVNATTTNLVISDNLTVLGTATSTFEGNLQVKGNFKVGTGSIDLFENSTSSFAQGINLNDGCFSVGGVCVGGSSGSSGLAGQISYYETDGTTLTATSSIFVSPSGNVGLGTTTPWAKLSINNFGGTIPQFIIASSTGSGATTTSFIVDMYGNVGVGTSTPQASLDISASSTQLRLTNSGASAGYASFSRAGSNDSFTLSNKMGSYVSSTTETFIVDIGTPILTFDTSDNAQVMTTVPANGQIQVSVDGGVTWNAVGPTKSWASIAVSSDGLYQSAVTADGLIYTSSDSGSNWTLRDFPVSAFPDTAGDIDMSADGSKQVALIYDSLYGNLFYSTDYGVTWAGTGGANFVAQIAMSDNGQTILGIRADYLAVSNNGGSSYSNVYFGEWSQVNVSSNGAYMTASSLASGAMVQSFNGGVTWSALASKPTSSPLSYTMSSDGMKQVVMDNVGSIWTSRDRGQTWSLEDSSGLGVMMSVNGQVAFFWSDGTITKMNLTTSSLQNQEVSIFNSATSTVIGEVGVTTFGNSLGATILNGSSLGFNIAGTRRATLSLDGFLGIGTTNPNNMLTVAGDISGTIITGSYFTATSTSQASTFTYASTTAISSTGWAYFATTQGSNVGIGTTSPGQKLSVAGDILGNNIIGSYFTATSTIASIFPYASTTALTISGTNGLTLASGLNGPLQAIGGLVSATSSIGVLYGGTGLMSAPSYGELLLGNDAGGYTLTATSSLGLLGSSTVSSITSNYLSKWVGSYFANSLLYDDGTNIGIGTTTPSQTLDVAGIANIQNYVNSSYFIATSTEIASIFPYASTTALTVSGEAYFTNILSTGSSTLQDFTFLTATGTSATTTNFFSDTLTATDLYTTNFTGLSGTSTNFAVLNSFSVTGSATSTFGNGLDLTGGCFSIAGVCVAGGGGGGSGTVNSGTQDQIAFYDTTTNAVSGTSTITILQNTNVGIGTTTPYAQLSVTNTGPNPSFLVEDSASPDTTPFVIDASGNVGIGTASPQNKLHVDGILQVGTQGANKSIVFPTLDNNVNWLIDSGTISNVGSGSSYDDNVLAIGSNYYFASTTQPRWGMALEDNWSPADNSLNAEAYFSFGSSSSATTDYRPLMIVVNKTDLFNPVGNISLRGVVAAYPSSPASTTPTFITSETGRASFGGSISGQQVTIYGSTGTSASVNTSVPVGGSLVLSDSGASAGNGGLLTFSAGSALLQFAGIKGSLTNGASNGAGDLIFTSRLNAADSTLSEIMRLVSSGNVGIGTTTPGQKLSVAGDILGNNIIGSYFTATSTTATSALSGNLVITGTTGLTGLLTAGNASTTQIGSTGSAYFATSAGNVGVGTTTPGAKLDVDGGSIRVGGGGSMLVNTNGTSFSVGTGSNTATAVTMAGSRAYFGYDGANAYLQGGSGKGIKFNVNSGTEGSGTVGTFTSAGNFGIGTTTPGQKLSVAGDILGNNIIGSYFAATSSTATSTFAGFIDVNGTGSNATSTFASNLWVKGALKVGSASAYIDQNSLTYSNGSLTLSSTGTSTITNNVTLGGKLLATGLSSDSTTIGIPGVLCLSSGNEVIKLAGVSTCIVSSQRFKHDINSLSVSGIDMVNSLRPVAFTYNGDNGSLGEQLGFIAEEVEQIDPRLVVHDAQGLPFSVRYENFTAVLAKAIQELSVTTSFVSNNWASTTALMAVDSNGNIGIGTSTPEYKLQVMGDIAATSFVNISTRGAKKDISYLSSDDSAKILTKIRDINVATYHYNTENPNNPLRLGLIAEEAPAEVLSVGGKGVDVYKLSTFMLAGIQAQQKQIEGIETRLARLEAGQSFASSAISQSSFMDQLISLGAEITQDLMKIKNLLVDAITTKNITIKADNVSQTGITIYDRVTGLPVCMFVANGVMLTDSGACSASSGSSNPSDSGATSTITIQSSGTSTPPQSEASSTLSVTAETASSTPASQDPAVLESGTSDAIITPTDSNTTNTTPIDVPETPPTTPVTQDLPVGTSIESSESVPAPSATE